MFPSQTSFGGQTVEGLHPDPAVGAHRQDQGPGTRGSPSAGGRKADGLPARVLPQDHIHFSHLRAMAKSPAHYRALETRPREDSLAMRIGRTIHAMVLGGDFIVYEGTRRGTEWTAFESGNAGREIITPGSEAAASREVADAVLSSPRAVELLAGQHEFCLAWKLGRRACAGHLDVLGANFITDLKTTTNAEPGWFVRHAIQMGYAAQMAWYFDGVVAAGLPVPENVYVVAVETKYPYVISTSN